MASLSGSGLQEALESGLANLDVPEEMIGVAARIVPDDTLGVVVYGSRARGDAAEASDLDLLALVENQRPSMDCENVSLSFYTATQLASGIGSLFGAHLRRDGRVIFDTNDQLESLVDSLVSVDVKRLFRRLSYFSVIFGSLDHDLPKHLPGLLRMARFFLRSALYALAIEQGRECFSVRELAVRYKDPKLATLLSSRSSSKDSHDTLRECLERLSKIVRPLRENPHGSLEALIVNEWNPESELIAVAMRALGTERVGGGYGDVRKVLL